MSRLVLKGIPVSSGIGIGKVYIFEQQDFVINRGSIGEHQVNDEINRLELAIHRTLRELHYLSDNFVDKLKAHESFIFEVHKAILKDDFFIQEIRDLIGNRKIFAENAVDIAIKDYIKIIEESDNEYAKQRVHDFSDIGSRLIKNIVGESRAALDKIKDGQVVAVKELTPSLAAMLGRVNVSGVVAEEGAGFLSHAVIILRGLGIPALNNIPFAEAKGFEGKPAVVDGFDGALVIAPGGFEVEGYRNALKSNVKKQEVLYDEKDKPAVTTDGYKIGISANISSIEECDIAVDKNVDGIGLVRTEILFIYGRQMPGEEEQLQVYSQIANRMYPKPVVIRTADIGGDKAFEYTPPAAGAIEPDLRGVRRSLIQKEQLMTQIRAIIRAAEGGNVRITFPMVNNAEEIREVKDLIRRVSGELTPLEKTAGENIKIGAVIETVEGIDHIDSILAEVDFISLGTNDLLQQTMELDRKSSVGGIMEYFHPVFLKTVQYCVEKAKQQGKPVSICGEMASDPMAAVILLGLGADDLSMSPYKALNIKSVIRKTNMEEARELCKKALKSLNKNYVRQMMSDWMKKLQD